MVLPERDPEGFLIRMEDWNEDVAQAMAQEDGFQLTADHFEIIRVVRDFYTQTGVSPVQRVLVRIVREALGDEKGQSLYLLQLFPGSPARWVARYAGLPKPANCL